MATLAKRHIYLLFKGAVPELSDAADDLDGESPDVVTTTVTGRRIGIELTGFFHGTAPKGRVSQVQRERFQRQVVLEAQRRFEADGGPPLHVQVGWFGHVVTDPLDRLAQDLADQVAAHVPIVPPTDTFADVMIEGHELPDRMAEWVASVHIPRTARATAHFWAVPQVGYIDADADGLRERIVDKEQKLSSYRRSDENWLLIHSGDDTLAASMALLPRAVDEVYTTAFDRVYVLELSGRVRRLRTSWTLDTPVRQAVALADQSLTGSRPRAGTRTTSRSASGGLQFPAYAEKDPSLPVLVVTLYDSENVELGSSSCYHEARPYQGSGRAGPRSRPT